MTARLCVRILHKGGDVKVRVLASCVFLTVALSATDSPLWRWIPATHAQTAPNHDATRADFDRLMTELSNWGRWGKDDQIGAVNLITPAKRKEALSSVKDGFSVSMARKAEMEPALDNPRPITHVMGGAGRGANPANPQTDISGASDTFTISYPEDLDAWVKRAHLKIEPGDAVFIRTGRWALRDAKGAYDTNQLAGLYITCAKWLRDHDAAILGSDGAEDVHPSGIDGITEPIHALVLVAMGMPVFDNLDLEAVSREAAKRNRWDFLVTASPAAVPGATGSVLNPIATF